MFVKDADCIQQTQTVCDRHRKLDIIFYYTKQKLKPRLLLVNYLFTHYDHIFLLTDKKWFLDACIFGHRVNDTSFATFHAVQGTDKVTHSHTVTFRQPAGDKLTTSECMIMQQNSHQCSDRTVKFMASTACGFSLGTITDLGPSDDNLNAFNLVTLNAGYELKGVWPTETPSVPDIYYQARAGRRRGAWAFHELRIYHTRPLRLNWGPKKLHFDKTQFWDPNINVRPKKRSKVKKTPKNDQNHFPTWRT